jgi:ATP-dependent DNA helicase RecQ
MNLDAMLQDHFGFDKFLPGQREAIEALLAHGKALAIFPTGGGKSLCYQLPALALDGITLVVSPLIALMKDQIDFLTKRGIAAARLDVSVTAEEWRDVSSRLQSGQLKLLYVAPERFNNERFLASISRLKISLFAIDEAHCISEWGHNFRPDYLKLADTARRINAERILTLTATATPAVAADIRAAFDIPEEASIVTGFYRPNLNLATSPVSAANRDALLLKRLQSRKPGSAIVYVTLQKTAERLAETLRDAGFPAEAYHAGMEADERSAIQERWMASDRGIAVATIAFGMGIDKSDVRYVYHYNLPKSLESYSQEIGRAGRDGQKSTVELLATPEDVPTLENFAYGDTPTYASLRSLVEELLGSGDELELSLYDLSSRHDMRPLVLRTALTYLELQGVLRQGTPFYAGYEIRPLQPMEEIFGVYKGEPAAFIRSIFEAAKFGRTWYSLNPDDVAEKLRQERRRVIRALEVLEEKGLVQLRASDVRNRYTLMQAGADAEALSKGLAERFLHRERQEQERLAQVLALVTHAGCQTAFLVAHFGETRPEPCGHCTYCITGRAQSLPSLPPVPPLPADIDVEALQALRETHSDALSEPRSVARFLCGLTSPSLTRARLSRHPLFGSLASYPFADVMAWAS